MINVLEKVKTNLYNAIEFYWDKKEEEILISALLDPRIKSLKFVEEKVCDEVKELLKSKYNQLKTDSLLATIRQLLATTSYTPSTPSFTQPSLFSIFGKNASQQHDDEVTIYLSLPKLDFEYDPFVWWNDHKKRFPILSKLTQIYLPVPATSILSERLFSDAEKLLTAKRTHLNSNLFNRLMFLKKNASFVKNIHPSKS